MWKIIANLSSNFFKIPGGEQPPQISQVTFFVKPQIANGSDSRTKIGELQTHELTKSTPLTTNQHDGSRHADDRLCKDRECILEYGEELVFLVSSSLLQPSAMAAAAVMAVVVARCLIPSSVVSKFLGC